MADNKMHLNESFFSLYRSIEAELNAVSLNIENLASEELTDELYLKFSRQMDNIDALFDKINNVSKDLVLEWENPDLYELLEKKQNINVLYGELNKQRRALSKKYEKGHVDEQEENLTRTPFISSAEEELETTIDSLEETPAEDEIIEEFVHEEPTEKKKSSLHKGESLSDIYPYENDYYKEEAQRLHMPVYDGKEYTAADIRNEQYRIEDERLYQEELKRRLFENEKAAFNEYYEKIKLSDEHLEKSHIDFSKDLGYESTESFQTADLSYSTEPAYEISDYTRKENPVSYDDRYISDRENHTQSYTEPAKVSYEQSSYESIKSEPVNENRFEASFNGLGGETTYPPGFFPQQMSYYNEEAFRLGMPMTEGKQYTAADIRNEQFRQEDARVREHQHRIEKEENRQAAFNQYYDKIKVSNTPLEKSHLEFSREFLDAKENQQISYFGYTPEGVMPLFPDSSSRKYTDDYHNIVRSNSNIYSAVIAGATGSSIEVPAAYADQMRFNLNLAKLDYQEKKGTPEERAAAQAYLEQRNAYSEFKNEVKNGRITLSEPSYFKSDDTRKTPVKRTFETGYSGSAFSYTPDGVVGTSFDGGKANGNRYEFINPGIKTRDDFKLNAKEPLKVSSAYEKALYDRMTNATAFLNMAAENAKNEKGITVPSGLESEIRLATDAWLGYRQAKRDGLVIVSDDVSSDSSMPNYKMWQTLGSTMQSKGFNPARPTKESVEEVDASLFKRESLLKRDKYIMRHFSNANYYFTNFSITAVSMTSRRLFQMIQSGDEDGSQSLRMLDSTRYYSSTAIGVAQAIYHAHPVASAAGSAASLAAKEYRMFGTLANQSKSEVARSISERTKLAKINKAEIKSLMSKGASLTADERVRLAYLMKEHAGNNLTLRKENGYLRYKTQNDVNLAAAQALKNNGVVGMKRVAVTRKMIDKEIKEVSKRSNEQMQKKFGSKTLISNKSLNNEIKDLTKHNTLLKIKIKALESKGSRLTANERKTLMLLKNEHKTLSKELANLFGLQKARRSLEEQMGALQALKIQLSKNAAAWGQGLFALSNFMMKPLREGDGIGAQGLARAISIASDRRVRKILKASLKGAKFTGKASLELLVPGSSQSIDFATKAVKDTASYAAISTKKAIKTGVSRAAAYGKKQIIKATPAGVRTAASKSMEIAGVHRFRIQKLVNSGKDWFANSAVGRGLAFLRRFGSNTAEMLRLASEISKKLLVKVTACILLVFLVVGIITMISTSFAGSAGSSVVLSPDEKDGKLDLTTYVEIIQEKQEKFDQEIADLQSDSRYDNVTITYGSTVMNNTKEMLSMMAVFFNQDLDTRTNTQVKNYLESLYDDSHFHIDTETHYQCSGCKTRSTGHRASCPEGCTSSHTVRYCPGHTDLEIEIHVLGFDEIFGADSLGNSGYNAEEGGLLGKFKITHYCAEKRQHICNNGPPYKTATGTDPTPGRTIAVDPNVIPLGTHVIINGHEYVAEDTGGSVESYQIDICVDTHEEALEKGTKRAVPVYNVSYAGEGIQDGGDWNGWTDDNVTWAKTIYQMNWSELYAGIEDYGGGIIEGGDLIVEGDFTWPVTSTTQSSGYGWRINPVTGEKQFHKGTDIPVPVGTPVHAAADGKVTAATYSNSAGNMIIIEHSNGVMTKYFHNSELKVRAGDTVSAGDVIALSGNTGRSTGPHLHFEFWVNGAVVNPRVQYDM